MTELLFALMLAAPPIFIAFRVRAARCHLCKAATASPLVGMLALWAAQPLVTDLGVPGPVQLVIGLAAGPAILELLPRAASRWLHAGPDCAAVRAAR